MRGAIPPIPQHVMAWCLVKQRDNFTFYPQSCGWVSASKLGPEIGQSSQGVYGFLQSLQADGWMLDFFLPYPFLFTEHCSISHSMLHKSSQYSIVKQPEM